MNSMMIPHEEEAETPGQTQEELLVRNVARNGGIASMVVRAAAACNKVIMNNCSICTVYCDKQVQYEAGVVEQYALGTNVALMDLFSKMDNGRDVQDFKEHLFDEQSVVETVSSRQEDE